MPDFIQTMFTWQWVNTWLVPFVWACTLFSVVMSFYTTYRTRKFFRETMCMTTEDYARLAVFSSWVKGGGRAAPLGEEIEFEMRQQYARMAKMKGEAFYTEFVQCETRADIELNAVIHRLGGTISHDKEIEHTSDHIRTRREPSGHAQSDRHGVDIQKP